MIDDKLPMLTKYFYVLRILGGYSEQTLADKIGVSRQTLISLARKGFPRLYFLALAYVFEHKSGEAAADAFYYFTDMDICDEEKIQVAAAIYEACVGISRKQTIKAKQRVAVKLFRDLTDVKTTVS